MVPWVFCIVLFSFAVLFTPRVIIVWYGTVCWCPMYVFLIQYIPWCGLYCLCIVQYNLGQCPVLCVGCVGGQIYLPRWVSISGSTSVMLVWQSVYNRTVCIVRVLCSIPRFWLSCVSSQQFPEKLGFGLYPGGIGTCLDLCVFMYVLCSQFCIVVVLCVFMLFLALS